MSWCSPYLPTLLVAISIPVVDGTGVLASVVGALEVAGPIDVVDDCEVTGAGMQNVISKVVV